MSRSAATVTSTSAAIFSVTLPSGSGGANNLSVTVQNPSDSGVSIEIAWDDVDTALVAGTGQILAPGDWRNIKALPVNAAGKAGVLALSLGGNVGIRVMSSATVL